MLLSELLKPCPNSVSSRAQCISGKSYGVTPAVFEADDFHNLGVVNIISFEARTHLR